MPMGGVYGARTSLCLDLDHVAELREAHRGDRFDPAAYAAICDKGGCSSVSVHLRRDRRYIQDRDVCAIMEAIGGRFNLGISLAEELIDLAGKTRPGLITVAPELTGEMTAGGGLDLRVHLARVGDVVRLFHDEGITVSLVIEPSSEAVDYAKECAADRVEICTAVYCNAGGDSEIGREIRRICDAAGHAAKIGLQVTAGGGLSYTNIEPLLDAAGLKEVNIGRSIISRSLEVGFRQALDEMLEILE